MTKSSDFTRNKPTITDADMVRAARCHRVVVSWDSMPTSVGDEITGLALKLMMADSAQETLLVEQYPAMVLRNLLDEFERADWKVSKRDSSPPLPAAGVR